MIREGLVVARAKPATILGDTRESIADTEKRHLDLVVAHHDTWHACTVYMHHLRAVGSGTRSQDVRRNGSGKVLREMPELLKNFLLQQKMRGINNEKLGFMYAICVNGVILIYVSVRYPSSRS